jgi:hypothetical protein
MSTSIRKGNITPIASSGVTLTPAFALLDHVRITPAQTHGIIIGILIEPGNQISYQIKHWVDCVYETTNCMASELEAS